MSETSASSETGCCPRFDPDPWDGREITWENRRFIRDRVRSVFHIPLNFGRVMKRNMEAIEAAGALDPDNVVLSDEASPWRAEVYIGVSRSVPGAREELLSGTFFAKVFEGPYSRAGAWAKELATLLEREGRRLEKLYFWYTTCPRCTKAYGKNYVVLLAQQ